MGNTLKKGFENVTYNPEAEKARQENLERARPIRQELEGIYQTDTDALKKRKSDFPNDNYYFYYKEKQLNDLRKYLDSNPDATPEELEAYKNKFTNYTRDTLGRESPVDTITLFGREGFFKAKEDDIKKSVLEKKMTEKQAESYKKLFEDIQKYSLEAKNNPGKYPPENAQAKLEQFNKNLQSLSTGGEEIDLAEIVTSPKSEEEVKETETTIKKLEFEENSFFSVKRMFSTIFSVSLTTVQKGYIIMFFLVSGMLAANNAIGRDIPYRILYFIYGGIFFPILLPYYIIKFIMWIFGKGTVPRIYRLLPIFKTPSDTRLGRFFLFPFTYETDEGEQQARDAFQKSLADMVGAKFEAGKNTGDILKNIVEKERSLSVENSSNIGSTLNSILSRERALSVQNTGEKLQGIVNAMKELPVQNNA